MDGQQRVTSLTLLLIFLYRIAKDKNLPVLQTIAPLIFSDNLREPKFNLDIPERLSVIEALSKGEAFNPDGKGDSIPAMYARYCDIEQNAFVDELEDGISHFIYWLLTRVGLIEIATDIDTYAYAIFETTNDRGKRAIHTLQGDRDSGVDRNNGISLRYGESSCAARRNRPQSRQVV